MEKLNLLLMVGSFVLLLLGIIFQVFAVPKIDDFLILFNIFFAFNCIQFICCVVYVSLNENVLNKNGMKW